MPRSASGANWIASQLTATTAMPSPSEETANPGRTRRSVPFVTTGQYGEERIMRLRAMLTRNLHHFTEPEPRSFPGERETRRGFTLGILSGPARDRKSVV